MSVEPALETYLVYFILSNKQAIYTRKKLRKQDAHRSYIIHQQHVSVDLDQ